MNNRVQELVPVLNPFLPTLSLQDQRIFKLLQDLQTYQGPQLTNILHGILTYWLEKQAQKNKYRFSLNLTWIFGSKLSFNQIIQRELGLTEKISLDPYQKLIYLAALLNYILKNQIQEDFLLVANELAALVRA